MSSTIRAYLLIETQAGESNAVLETLKLLQQTVQVDRVTGPYDLICIIEAVSLDEVGEIVREKIHTTPGISRTMSCIRFK
ncbi:MAG: Lrp/AsnC ligand binding domain-containing protein [Dehalococcoidia bacterium]|jgi:DNA-binding Lrp family transcriptional regulator|uniref:Transcription regulator AsnC/Lrp ligand binding domain-containing protein n=1 Tax=marine metagenome TaxID=408172 RepID=A0A382NIK8_9ZZZZ|nr:Lrp/AsnC ligand binding domain-containing protein [Dehalococcoidia bacterium]|tara:strand:+ start:448 stop:687 length:240 start_codon:yes stop_codon:yes gene_type:complete